MPKFSASNREITEIWEHIDTINHEMGSVKNDVSEMKVSIAKIENDVGWLKTYLPPLVFVVTILGAVLSYFLKS